MRNLSAVAGPAASEFGSDARIVDLGERRCESHRLAASPRAHFFRDIFAGAADRHLHQHGAERSENHLRQ